MRNTAKKPRHYFVILACLLLASPVFAEAWAVESFRPVRIFDGLSVDRPFKLTPVDEGFMVLDRDNHRLLSLDREGRVLKQIARIGQGKDELYFPTDYAVGADGRFYVATGHVPFEVKIFDANDRNQGGFEQGDTPELAKFARSWTIAVGREGTIFLSQPRNRHLVTVYDSRGKEIRGIGEKIAPAEVYPDACKTQERCKDRRYHVTLNRVSLATGADGDLYVAFDNAPIVRRYDAEGRLIFETRLRGGHVETIHQQQWSSPGEWSYYSYNVDGVQVLTIINGLSVDEASGRIYCLVGSQAIYVLSRDGTQIAILEQEWEKPRALDSIAVRGHDGYLTNWEGFLHFEIPAAIRTTEVSVKP